ncbi:cadherin-like beta sandwich domain-containing protein [Vescimonas sp.]|uniref:cadherin-like beta sandwich domain-containing protein n=1 Tax=Vescimonas sp. TaxID=2892404 RepID=UPI00307C3275
MKKRIISLLLALVMALSLLPVSVLAADDHTGQVHVTVENTTWAKADGAPWEGTLLDEWVTLKADSTMMSCIVDALTAKGYSQTGADTGYISSINGIEEKEAAKGSGWMGTLNDWFTSEGFAAYTVANGKLKAGDEIAVQHTCNLGADIGGAFGDSNKTLKAIALSAGELTPAFSSDNHAYTMILPDGTDSLTVTPTASNKQFRVRIYAGNTEYRRMDAIPVQHGTVITLKVGNDGDTAPEVYTITLQAAGTLLNKDSVSLNTIREDGSVGSAVALTFDEGSSAFSGNLAYYTQKKAYNDGGFTVSLSGLPEGATAQLKDSTGKVLADFVNGTASTGSTVVAGSGAANFYFYIAVTAQGRTETYKLTLSKKSEFWNTMRFPVSNYDPEVSYYGYPEGTLFQTDADGNRTGETGFSSTWWNYTVYISPTITQFGTSKIPDFIFSHGNFNMTVYVNGEVYIPTKLFGQARSFYLRNPITIRSDKTVIDFVMDGNNSKVKNEEKNVKLHTTITVIVVKTTPAELTDFVNALPDTSSLVYSEHYNMVQQYKRIYGGYTDEEKAQLSPETVQKLQDSVARVEELKKRHEDGIQAWANLVNTFAGKVTAENYAQYYDAVKDSEAMYLKLSDAQRKEIDKTEQKTAYDAAFKVVTEQSILDSSSIGKPTNYPDDFMMTSLFFNLDLGHEDTYYPAVFREIWTNRPKSLYPKYTQEKGLPYTLPGILQFEIKDESIFEIKEVEGTYKDGGLGGGSTYPAMKYYLVPKKAGTTTFTVTFTDKAGNFYGQIPEIPVHVNSPEESAIADLRNNLTNFTSLGKTSKYDTWTYDYGAEGAEFTFRVNGQNPKVSVYNYLQYNADGTPVVTTYTPDAKGNVTILLKDGYNGIEVTADYQGHTVTQVYSLKGKVTRYVQENISRPGEDLRTGDTAGIWIIGKPVELHKILRIYNMGGSPTFRTDMYLSNIADTDRAFNVHWYDRSWNDVFGYSRIAAVLTEAGEVRLTDGYSIYRGYGSAPGSEGDQGNTGGIADSTAFPFGKYADIVLQVKENENYQLQPKYESVASNGGVVKAGEEITVSVPTLPIEQEAEQKYLMHVTLNFATTIPGAENIKSTWNRGTDSWGSGGTTAVGPEVALKNITFMVPKTTPAGTYRIYGGYLDATYRNGGEAYLDSYDYLYEREIGDLTITVLKGDIETVEDLIDAIGADVTLDSEAAITAAKSAYDALSDEDKALVDADKVDALNAAIIKLNRLKHADLMASLDTIYKTTGDFMSKLGTPTVNSTGGEWMVIGLARSGRTVPAGYYDNVVEYVKANADKNERLHRAKVTDNARVILALTAIGKDVTNVGGHNLLKGLDNMDYVQTQGINGPIFTLIALDSHNYPTMGDVTREKLIQVILDAQLTDGGWALSGNDADPDMTAMAIQSLAPYYKTNETVKAAVDKALEALSALQRPDGGFGSWGTINSESCAQVIVALTALGIDPTADSRFVKNGLTVLDALAGFYVTGGGFYHTKGESKVNGMATEQGYYALAAYYRFANAQTRLYDMTDVTIQTGGNTPATGDTGVMVWVVALPVTALGAAFVLKRKKREE